MVGKEVLYCFLFHLWCGLKKFLKLLSGSFFDGNGQELGGCSSNLFFVLSAVLLNFYIVALCDTLISISIYFGISSASVVAFSIVGVVCSFVYIIIVILVFSVGSNVIFSSINFTS